MSEVPLVYIIILTWNRCEDTLMCLASVSQMNYKNFRILLVDNASQDGTAAAVKQTFPQVTILMNEHNLGYAKGCNIGIQYALAHGSDYVFLLNNDTLVDRNTLGNLIVGIGLDVGMAAPKIYYAHDSTRIWSIGGKCHPCTLEKIGDARGEIDIGQWSQVLERDYFVGCALVLSRSLLTTIGLFDERFFMYYEDSDLSLRARKAGFRLLLIPDAQIWHKVAMSSGGIDSPSERYLMARSSVLFFRKHVSGLRWLIVVPYRLGSAIKTMIRLSWHGNWKAAVAYARGLWEGMLM